MANAMKPVKPGNPNKPGDLQRNLEQAQAKLAKQQARDAARVKKRTPPTTSPPNALKQVVDTFKTKTWDGK